MPLLQGTNIQRALPNSYWPVDAGLPLDLDMSASSLWLWQSSEAGVRGGIDYHVPNTATSSESLRNLQRCGFQKGISGLDNSISGAPRLGEARITADIHVTFPPGNAAFPSTFSAHLAACEFFIKQNRAYKQRAEPGGSEA
jgi:hypothetical protein